MRKDDDDFWTRSVRGSTMLVGGGGGGGGGLVALELGLDSVEHACEHVDVVGQCLSR